MPEPGAEVTPISPLVFSHNLVAYPQSESRTLTHILCCKKRVEHTGYVVLGYSASVVLDLKPMTLPARVKLHFQDLFFFGQVSHGVNPVEQKVHQNLL